MGFSVDRRAVAERTRLLQGRPNFGVTFSKSQVAASLWDYGEDAVAARALEMSDGDLAGIQNIAAWYHDPSYALPLTGQQITNNHVVAFAALTYFEGEVRALSRTRRRAQKARPPEFQER